jgi:hypothetical protein
MSGETKRASAFLEGKYVSTRQSGDRLRFAARALLTKDVFCTIVSLGDSKDAGSRGRYVTYTTSSPET